MCHTFGFGNGLVFVCQRPVLPMFPRVLCPRLDLLPGCNTGGGYTGTRLTSTVEVGLNLPFEGTGKEGDVLETGWCRYKRDIEATAKRGLRLEFGGNQVEAQTPSTHAHTHTNTPAQGMRKFGTPVAGGVQGNTERHDL